MTGEGWRVEWRVENEGTPAISSASQTWTDFFLCGSWTSSDDDERYPPVRQAPSPPSPPLLRPPPLPGHGDVSDSQRLGGLAHDSPGCRWSSYRPRPNLSSGPDRPRDPRGHPALRGQSLLNRRHLSLGRAPSAATEWSGSTLRSRWTSPTPSCSAQRGFRLAARHSHCRC